MDNKAKSPDPDVEKQKSPDSRQGSESSEAEAEFVFKKPADPIPRPGPTPTSKPSPVSNQESNSVVKELFRKISTCSQVMDIGLCEYAVHGVLPPKLSLKKAYAYWNDKANKCMELLEPLPCTQENLRIQKADGPWRLIIVLLDALTQLKCAMDRLDELPDIAESPAELLHIKGMRNSYNIIRMAIELVLIPTLPNELLHLGGGSRIRDPTALSLVQLSEYIKFHRSAYVLQQFFLLSQHRVFATRIFDHKHLLHFMTSCIHTCYAPVANPGKNKASPLTPEEYGATISAQVILRKTFEGMIFPRLDKSHLIVCLFPIGSDKAPKWFQKKCQDLAKKLVCSKHGLASTASGLVDLFSTSTSAQSKTLAKSGAVMHCLLIQCFSGIKSKPEDCIKLIDFFISEILTLFKASIAGDLKEGIHPMEFSMTAAAMYAAVTITELDKDYCIKNLWDRLFSPIMTLDMTGKDYQPVKLSEVDKIFHILEIVMSRYRVLGMKFEVGLLHGYFCKLFKIYSACTSFLNSNVQLKWASDEVQRISLIMPEVLADYVESGHTFGSPNPCISQICRDVLILRDKRDNSSALSFHLKCIEGETNVIVVERSEELPKDPMSSLFESIQNETKILVQNILQNKRINTGTVEALFSELICVEEGEPKVKVNPEDLGSLDLSTTEGLEQFVAIVLLAELGRNESMLDKIDIDSGEKSFPFVTFVLSKLVGQLKEAEETRDSFEFTGCLEHTLQIFLTFIQILKNPKFAKSGDEKLDVDCSNVHWEDLQSFAPLILTISESKHPAIANTQIQILADHIYEELMLGPGWKGGKKKNQNEKKSEYQEAMANLMDPMIPVIGGGLLELKKCIERRDAQAMDEAEKLKDILFRLLHHNDSYIYLGASNALVALGIAKHELIVRPIIQEFAKAKETDTTEDVIRFRTQCGGCLIRILQALGDFSQGYRNELMNACFGLLSTDNSDLKSTALLLMASLASVLKFSLGTVLTDIWTVIKNVMSTEKDDQVRRSAMSLLHGTLKGIGATVTAQYCFKDPDIGVNLRDMRRKLQLYRQNQTDFATLCHISECLTIVSKIGSALMTVDATALRKEIHVLRPPTHF